MARPGVGGVMAGVVAKVVGGVAGGVVATVVGDMMDDSQGDGREMTPGLRALGSSPRLLWPPNVAPGVIPCPCIWPVAATTEPASPRASRRGGGQFQPAWWWPVPASGGRPAW